MKHNYLKHLFTALLLLCATVASAHDFEVDGIYYNILSEEEKTVEVTYRGNSNTGGYSNAYTGSVDIPSMVTYNDLTYSVTSIGREAFSGCSGLTRVTIPNSVTSIGYSAFRGCSSLRSITIPNSVTSIGNYAFFDCSGLTVVINCSNLRLSIGSTDYGCVAHYAEKVINVQNCLIDGNFIFGTVNGVNTLVGYCGDDTKLTLPADYKGGNYAICDFAFSRCTNLTSVTIPNSVTSIGSGAFFGCYGLTSVTIPNSVTSIGREAFNGCSGLTRVTIPNSVTSIENYAFIGCTGLTSVTSLIPADELFAINSYVFNYVDKTTCTLYVPYGAKETYAATEGWNEFVNIVELEKPITEVTVTINQYGSATYCSEYALDFSEVEGLKAYAATGYKSNSGVVTLTRVQTAEGGVGLFLKGEPGEYVVPVIESTDEHSLNMLVGTLESTIVNGTDGEMTNYKYTVKSGTNTPMFYQFADNSTLSAGKAYLQIPTAWLPATAQKSVSIRFDDGETTDIDELKGKNGEVKTIYDLQGRVVENPTKGIYIVDGKKVFINK